jgi:hypothetical protein
LALGRSLTETNVRELLAWKFGNSHLPEKERREKVAEWSSAIRDNLAWLNSLRQAGEFDQGILEQPIARALEAVKLLNPPRDLTMAIYLLHIARPQDIPILDRHVLRASYYISYGKIGEPRKTPENYHVYRPFFLEFCARCHSSARQVDRASMAFGQFLEAMAQELGVSLRDL